MALDKTGVDGADGAVVLSLAARGGSDEAGKGKTFQTSHA